MSRGAEAYRLLWHLPSRAMLPGMSKPKALAPQLPPGRVVLLLLGVGCHQVLPEQGCSGQPYLPLHDEVGTQGWQGKALRAPAQEF